MLLLAALVTGCAQKPATTPRVAECSPTVSRLRAGEPAPDFVTFVIGPDGTIEKVFCIPGA